MRCLQLLLTGWVLLTAAAAAAAPSQGADPRQVVRTTADQVLAEVTANRAALEADPSGIYRLVEATVVPQFDFVTMSRAAMGRYWSQATPAQQAAVTREFKELLVRTYAVALLGYSGQQIEYLPVQLQGDERHVVIPTRIDPASGASPVPINYRMRRVDGDWLVYDVVIDGVSLVINYRSTFASAVRQGGVDGLIRQLAERNRQLRG